MGEMIYIGIDPGQQGAIAIVWPHNHIEVHDMPCDKDGDIDILKIAEHIWPLGQDVIDSKRIKVYIEKAVMFRGQGAGSSGSYMKGYGKILGMFEMMGLDHVEVHPRTWKTKFGLTIKKDKEETKKDKAVKKKKLKMLSLEKAKEFAPHIKFMTDRGRMLDGRAEAILIAQYGKMIKNENE